MWKKLLAALVFIGVAIAQTIGGQLGKEVGKSAFSPSQPSQEQIDKLLYEGFSKAAEQSNARGAIMVDQETRLDSSVAGPGARLTYFYSLPKYSSRDIQRSWLLEVLQPEIEKGVCRNKTMQPSIRYGGTYVYAYSGNDGVEIGRFEINRRNCGY